MDEEHIFFDALEINSPAERSAFLAEACGNNVRLRQGVEALLRHNENAHDFLESPPHLTKRTIDLSDGDTAERIPPTRWPEFRELRPESIQRIAQYEIVRVIGVGGMGVVLEARDSKLERHVAIKVLTSGPATAESQARFLREARTAARLNHPHVVSVYEADEEGAAPYLVMEYVAGPNLQQKIDEGGRLPVSEVLRIASQIAAGLAAAHAGGLVHRDIKPANILLAGETEQVKIADFGLARGDCDASVTGVDVVSGTPQYMSPEQAHGKAADARSDLYSLGAVMYTMCTGRPAFSGEATLAVLRNVTDQSPEPIRELNPDVPLYLEQIILRLMSKDPRQRFQSASEVATLLEQHLTQQTAGSTSRVAADPRSRQPGRYLQWLAAAGGLLVLAGVIFIVTRPDGSKIKLHVPDNSTVRVSAEGNVAVELGDERKSGPGDARAKSREIIEPPAQDSHEQWSADFAKLAPAEQARQLGLRLQQLNPTFDGQLTPTIESGVLTGVQFRIDSVTDIRPLAAADRLRQIKFDGNLEPRSALSDLSPLRGLKLELLECGRSQVRDLSPLEGMPLKHLTINDSRVTDLSPLSGMSLELFSVQSTAVGDLSVLRGMPLHTLNCSNTNVRDLSPLATLPLQYLYMDGTKADDLSPLSKLPLKVLNWRGYDFRSPRHSEVIRSIHSLEFVNGQPVSDFWKMIDASDP